MHISIVMRGLLPGLFLLSSFAVAAMIEDPQKVIRETGDKVLSEVTARRADLEANPN